MVGTSRGGRESAVRSASVEWRSPGDIPARQSASEVGTASTAPPAERREGFAANAARLTTCHELRSVIPAEAGTAKNRAILEWTIASANWAIHMEEVGFDRSMHRRDGNRGGEARGG